MSQEPVAELGFSVSEHKIKLCEVLRHLQVIEQCCNIVRFKWKRLYVPGFDSSPVRGGLFLKNKFSGGTYPLKALSISTLRYCCPLVLCIEPFHLFLSLFYKILLDFYVVDEWMNEKTIIVLLRPGLVVKDQGRHREGTQFDLNGTKIERNLRKKNLQKNDTVILGSNHLSENVPI